MLKNAVLIDLLKQEVRSAVGCTEPGAVAYTAALAAEHCKGDIVSIRLLLSPGVMKNGYSVNIPGTGAKGFLLAAALGALLKDSSKGLKVLHDVDDAEIEKAEEMVKNGLVMANWDWDLDGIYVKIRLQTTQDICEVVVKDGHTNVQSIVLNGSTVFCSEARLGNREQQVVLRSQGLKSLIQQVQLLPSEQLYFLLEGLEQNRRVAQEGLARKLGLGVGRGISCLMEQQVIKGDIVDKARMMAAAAADARMAGTDLPVSTSFGSGNQGILISLTIGVVADHLQVTHERLALALAIGHIVNGYVKECTGRISPLCGCSVAAGLGATAAVSWLLGNDWAGISGAMNNVLGSLTGMLCDGAKGGCALKLATSAGEAIIAAFLSNNGVHFDSPEGVVAGTIEDSINNLGLLGRTGMADVDRVMLKLIADNGNAISNYQ